MHTANYWAHKHKHTTTWSLRSAIQRMPSNIRPRPEISTRRPCPCDLGAHLHQRSELADSALQKMQMLNYACSPASPRGVTASIHMGLWTDLFFRGNRSFINNGQDYNLWL